MIRLLVDGVSSSAVAREPETRTAFFCFKLKHTVLSIPAVETFAYYYFAFGYTVSFMHM